MSPVAVVWTQFAFCVLVIGVAGVQLTRYGDAIADKTGMGGTWIGLVLLATVTSLPELAAGVTASAFALLPDIAAGDVFGSCAYNLAILGLLDLFARGRPVLSRAGREHVLSGAFGILLIGIASLGLIAGQFGIAGTLNGLTAGIGWATPLLILFYGFALHRLHGWQEREVAEFTEEEQNPLATRPLRALAIGYGIAAAFVVAAGVWLPFVSADLAAVMGWQHAFTGTVFTALTTSLPELVVTLAALRLGAIDMAVGNILGSNLFNMLILAVDDLVYPAGPIYADVSLAHLVSGIAAMGMTGAVIAAVYLRPTRRWPLVGGWVTPVLLCTWLLATWLVWRAGVAGH